MNLKVSLWFILMIVLNPVYGTPQYTYRIVNTYPHDPLAFTQGLLYYQGFLYESTGLQGASSLRKVDLSKGKILKINQLSENFFAEGIALWRDRIIQLTWRNHLGFVYNRQTFQKLNTFSYDTEGWGLTQDGQKLIMSDGSDKLYFLEPNTFQKIGFIEVKDQTTPVFKLNELEYIKGEIFANVWQSNKIARISPKSGQVLGWIDLSGLSKLSMGNNPQRVLNGIAYDDEGQRLFVTGKWWSQLFEIELLP